MSPPRSAASNKAHGTRRGTSSAKARSSRTTLRLTVPVSLTAKGAEPQLLRQVASRSRGPIRFANMPARLRRPRDSRTGTLHAELNQEGLYKLIPTDQRAAAKHWVVLDVDGRLTSIPCAANLAGELSRALSGGLKKLRDLRVRRLRGVTRLRTWREKLMWAA